MKRNTPLELIVVNDLLGLNLYILWNKNGVSLWVWLLKLFLQIGQVLWRKP